MTKKIKPSVTVRELAKAIQNALKEHEEILVCLNGHRAIPDVWITIEHQSFWKVQLFKWVFNIPVGKKVLLKIAESLSVRNEFIVSVYSNSIPLELRTSILSKLEQLETKLKIRLVSPSKSSFALV